jgi:hypothetical protein
MRAARLLRIRLAEPLPGRAGDPGHRSERGADGATRLLCRKAGLLLPLVHIGLCVGMDARYGTHPEGSRQTFAAAGAASPNVSTSAHEPGQGARATASAPPRGHHR